MKVNTPMQGMIHIDEVKSANIINERTEICVKFLKWFYSNKHMVAPNSDITKLN